MKEGGGKKPPAVSGKEFDQLLHRTSSPGLGLKTPGLFLCTLVESQWFKESFIAQQKGLVRKLKTQLPLAIL